MFAIRRGEIGGGGVHGRVEMSDARKDASNAADDAESGRLPAIDILRGLAIFWVILFHLWGDIKFFPGAPSGYYEAFHDRLSGDGTTYHLFTAFTDIVFRDGFQGVPLFMMISGISLTIAAYRAGDALRWPRFFLHRFRKLMVPYWAGVAITYGVMAAIAWRQISIGDGSFSDHFTRGVSISLLSRIEIDRQVVFASIALIPRLTRAEWFFAPQLALWFVGLLAQYYLLFPLLFVLMKRIGVLPFVVLTFGLTVAANWWIVDNYGAPEFKFWLVTGWAPFRLFEFTAGMGIGWLLAAPGRARALAFVRNPFVIIAAIAVGLVVHTTGDLMIGRWSVRYWQSLALPLSTLGLALLVLPLLTKRPGRAEAFVLLRALAFAGVMSYAILIVNDPMRLVGSQLRLEQVSDRIWWTFVVGVYVPVSILIAWPLAHLFGLIPSKRKPVRIEPVASEPEAALVPATT